MLEELKAKGVRAECPTCDISDLVSLETALKQYSESMPPIKGCIQSSMVLRVSQMPHASKTSL
jgi:hypothetical protein